MYAKDYHDLGTPAAASGELVTLEIDGATITVPAGTSIMRAAALADRDVPKLCATDTLKAFGSCRVCLVEIEGRKGFPASCTTEVAAGMKVRTQSEALTKLRRERARALRLRASHGQLPGFEPLRARDTGWTNTASANRASRAPRRRATCTPRSRWTPAIRISASTTTCASSVRVACAPARKPRARMR